MLPDSGAFASLTEHRFSVIRSTSAETSPAYSSSPASHPARLILRASAQPKVLSHVFDQLCNRIGKPANLFLMFLQKTESLPIFPELHGRNDCIADLAPPWTQGIASRAEAAEPGSVVAHAP